MVWFILILIIVGYVIWKFNDDSKKVARRNESFGGMKKMFPEFVQPSWGYDWASQKFNKVKSLFILKLSVDLRDIMVYHH